MIHILQVSNSSKSVQAHLLSLWVHHLRWALDTRSGIEGSKEGLPDDCSLPSRNKLLSPSPRTCPSSLLGPKGEIQVPLTGGQASSPFVTSGINFLFCSKPAQRVNKNKAGQQSWGRRAAVQFLLPSLHHLPHREPQASKKISSCGFRQGTLMLRVQRGIITIRLVYEASPAFMSHSWSFPSNYWLRISYLLLLHHLMSYSKMMYLPIHLFVLPWPVKLWVFHSTAKVLYRWCLLSPNPSPLPLNLQVPTTWALTRQQKSTGLVNKYVSALQLWASTLNEGKFPKIALSHFCPQVLEYINFKVRK